MRRAFTLVEVLVACGLMTILLVAVLSMLVGARSLYLSASERTANLGTLARVLNRIEMECQGAQLSGMKWGNSAGWLLVAAVTDSQGQVVTDASGSLVVQRYLFYYWNRADGTLRRCEFASAPSDPNALRDGSGEVLADHVNDCFAGSNLNCVDIRLGLDSWGSNGREDQQYAWKYLGTR